ncbi:FAD:protein FMN transferase [Mycoplasmatota bacterium WC30]
MKKLIIIFIALSIAITLTSCDSEYQNPNQDYCVQGSTKGVYLCDKRTTSYFDTTVSLKLYNTESDTYDIEEIFSYFETTLETYHQYFDKYHEYQDINNVYTINHSDGEVILDDILFDAIVIALENENIILNESQPLFNIALNPVLNIWHDARESGLCDLNREIGISYCPVPSDLIDGIEFNTDPDDIVLDNINKSISFDKTDMSIDLGGFAKGYVSKVISDYLNDLNVKYLLNNGNSNVIAGGINPNNDSGEYTIALTTPDTDFHLQTEYFQYIQIPKDLAVVSSGNYQRFFKGIDDSEVYHHIINPLTNYPGGYSMSVTVLYPDSAIADILSTAIYLMPLDDAMEFVNNYEDLEAIWYLYDDTFQYSDGFADYIYLLD